MSDDASNAFCGAGDDAGSFAPPFPLVFRTVQGALGGTL